jgi:hypothetical protein
MRILQRQRSAAEFAAGFSQRLPRFIEDSTSRQLAAPDLAGCDPEVQAAVRDATTLGAEMLLMAMRTPAAVASAAEVRGAPLACTAAQHDIPLSAVLSSYRISHAVALDHLLAHAEEADTPMEIVRTATRNVFWHMDSVVRLGSRLYVEERRRINSRPERAKYLRVKAMLDGAAALGLPYPVDDHHVAIVLRGAQPAATLAAVARAAGSAPLLVTEAPDGKVWAWLACEWCENEVVLALREHARGPIAAGVSGHEAGADGFRAVHRRAQLALRLGSQQGRSVTTFADVALEALAFGGQDLAREFVESEMRQLTEPGRRAQVVRETLTAYFAARSAAAAAIRLGVSERTVTYRLRHAERMLGRPLTTRRAELETAMRLHAVLGPTVRAA